MCVESLFYREFLLWRVFIVYCILYWFFMFLDVIYIYIHVHINEYIYIYIYINIHARVFVCVCIGSLHSIFYVSLMVCDHTLILVGAF